MLLGRHSKLTWDCILPHADDVYLIGDDDIRTIERNAEVLLNVRKDIGLAVNTGNTKYCTWKYDVIEAG